MELIPYIGNTYLIRGRLTTILYRLSAHSCVLIDNGWPDEGPELLALLEREKLTPVALVCSHMHIDHHGNSRRLREKYRAPIIMPKGEADICENPISLHSFFEYHTRSESYRRVIDEELFCDVDQVISPNQLTLEIEGTGSAGTGSAEKACGGKEHSGKECGGAETGKTEFRILHLPGHSCDQIGIVTPDDVCYVADAILSRGALSHAVLPFCWDWEADRKSKLSLCDLPYRHWVMPHNGTLNGRIDELVRANVERMDTRLREICCLADTPMTLCELEARCRAFYHLRDDSAAAAVQQNRHLRAYFHELILRERLKPVMKDGLLCYVKST